MENEHNISKLSDGEAMQKCYEIENKLANNEEVSEEDVIFAQRVRNYLDKLLQKGS